MGDIKNKGIDNDPIAEKREEKALRNFKQVLRELLYLLMQSAKSNTASLYWVNNHRGQFVLESSCSSFTNTTFQDRVDFQESYLTPYKDITEPVQLEVGVHVEEDRLSHYYKHVPVRFINVIPFVNNDETVALAVLESNSGEINAEIEEAVFSFLNAMSNLLYTFIELSDLSRDESQWHHYEEMLDQLNSREDHAVLIDNMMVQLQSLIAKGGVSFLCRMANNWRVVLNTNYAQNCPPVGTILHENAMSYDALKTGKPSFAIHFNTSLRRVSSNEPPARGATLAIPLLLHDRRQGLVLVYDENPLLFKESVKHKMTNLVRISALKMMASKDSYRVDTDFMSHESGALCAPMMERVILREIKRRSLFPEVYSWVAMFTFEEINTLRTRFTTENLRGLQKQVVARSSAELDEFTSICGFHADYVYTALIQSSSPEGVQEWISLLKRSGEVPFECRGEKVNLSFRIGVTPLNSNFKDSFDAINAVKKVFSEATRRSEMVVEA